MATQVYGAGATVHHKFTTRDAGVPFTLGGSPVVSVYKDASLTQSVAGVTLTVDFDSITGLNHVAIDTSADGTFYSNGGHFELAITTGTVNGTSVVGEVIGDFDLAAAGPTSSDIAAIKAKTDNLPAAPASTTNITAGTLTTVTNLTNLPSIPNNWITAAGIAANALNGKGDWLTSLGATAPANWINAASIAASALNGKGDWLLASSYTAAPSAASIATAVLTDTGDNTVAGSPGKILAQLLGAFTSTSSVFTAASLVNAPTGGGGTDPWATVLPGSYASNQAGYILAAIAGYVDTEITSIISTLATLTTNISTINTTLNTVASNVTTILGDVTTIVGQTGTIPTAVEIAAAVQTTQMVESYATLGIVPSMSQALMMILQRLNEFTIVDTTITVNKVGGTTAFVLATDDATNPTSSHRTA